MVYSGGVLKTGILNPAINSLISRIRHTNTLVISDRGFPFWPQIETVDISLIDDIPRVLDVLQALRKNFVPVQVFMAEEFLSVSPPATQAAFAAALGLQLGGINTYGSMVERRGCLPGKVRWWWLRRTEKFR